MTRLGVDYLNLYIIHRFDYSTPMAETMEALDRLVRDGRARALGASAMYGYQLHNLQRVADENGWTRLSSLQNHYNLLYREDERELIPVVRQYGMSLTPYSPLASGHLTRSTWDSDSVRSTTDGTMRQKYDRDREIDMPIVVLEAFEGDDAVRAFSLELSAEEVAFLEEPYVAHDLVGPLARPSEKALAGTVVPQQPGQKNA